jgi:uncharacterized protein (TIGR02246 family)
MNQDEDAVRAVLDQWFAALNAMIAGDPGPVASIFSRSDDLIYLSGEGTYQIGFAQAMTDWRAQAEKSLGGHATPSDVKVIMSGDTAAVALVSHAVVNTPGGGTRKIELRHSNVFRKEDGAWKMILHHADNSPVWTEVVGR